MDAVVSWGGMVLAFVLGLVTKQAHEHWDRRHRDNTHVSEAATAIRVELNGLLDDLRRQPAPEVTAEIVSDAWLRVAAAIQEHDHRLPAASHHLRQSLVIALGHACGSVAFAHLPGTQHVELTEYDRMAQDDAVTYMQLVYRQLGRIADRPEQSEQVNIPSFDTWWRQSGRDPHFDPMQSAGPFGFLRALLGALP